MRDSSEIDRAWGEWIGSLRAWHLFGGLTFDQRRFRSEVVLGCRVPRVISRDMAIGRFKRWIARSESFLGRRIDYVAALQYQRNGWPHFHPLLDIGTVVDGDIALLGAAWYQENGFGRLEEPRCREAVCEYAARYLARDLACGDVLFSGSLGHVREFQVPLGGLVNA